MNIPPRVRPLLIVAVTAPVWVFMWTLIVAFWAGMWGAGNLYYGVTRDSAPAIARGLRAVAVPLSVSGRVAQVWGHLPLPRAGTMRAAAPNLRMAGQLTRTAAPLSAQLLGFDQPARYLVCALNDAELFGSGGAPLDVAVIEVSHGRFTVTESGAMTKFNPNNEPFAWPVTGGRPWYRDGKKYPIANANFHPNFPFSGRNLATAWAGLGHEPVDGVVTVDVFAVSALLSAVGPIQTQVFGEVNADNVLRKILVDAYRDLPWQTPGAMEKRQQANSQLRAQLLAKLTTRETLPGAVAAVWRTVPGRHVQAYLTTPEGQRLAEIAGLDAALTRPDGRENADLVGVFIQSGVSKLAIFGSRAIRHDVVIASDGSAQVTQRVAFTNDIPEGLSGDPTTHEGYLALIFRQKVAYRMPLAASLSSARVASGAALVAPSGIGPFADDAGGQVVWQGQDIAPHATATTIVKYRLPAGTFGASGERYRLYADPQAVVRPVALTVRVRFAAGGGRAGNGWAQQGDWLVWEGNLDRPLRLSAAAS